MFDISWSEFLLIGIVALVVIGPKELPTVMRTLGQWTRKVRAMAADFQDQFQEAMREAEVADLKNEVDDLARKVRSADPIKSVREDFETMGHDFERALDSGSEAAPAEQTAALPDPAASAEAAAAGSEPATAVTDTADPAATDPAATETADAETGKPVAAVPAPAKASAPSAPSSEETGKAAAPAGDTVPADATGHSG